MISRSIRPLTKEEVEKRDIAEIEHLNKGGPIAIADYFADNNGEKDALSRQLDAIMQKADITL